MCKKTKGTECPFSIDGTYHGTDGTCPRDRRDAHQGVSRQNSLCLLVFFLSPIQSCFCCDPARLLERGFRERVGEKKGKHSFQPPPEDKQKLAEKRKIRGHFPIFGLISSLTLQSLLFSFSLLFLFSDFPCFFVRFSFLFQGF